MSCIHSQAAVFDWSDFGTPINNVDAGDSFLITNVDDSGVDFTFTFDQSLDSRTYTSFNAIISETNNAPESPLILTGNNNLEGLYTSNPLYLATESQFYQDEVTLTITTSAPVEFTNFIIGDIDRFLNPTPDNSYEDAVYITSSLLGSNIGVHLTTTSSSIDITGNLAEATSDGLLASSDVNSQVQVRTLGLVDTLTITYFNGDDTGGGLTGDGTQDGRSNSQWITFGSDDGLTNFSTVSAVPEPSSVGLISLGGLVALSRRRRKA